MHVKKKSAVRRESGGATQSNGPVDSCAQVTFKLFAALTFLCLLVLRLTGRLDGEEGAFRIDEKYVSNFVFISFHKGIERRGGRCLDHIEVWRRRGRDGKVGEREEERYMQGIDRRGRGRGHG